MGTVIIHYHLCPLPVSLARGEDIGACPLEHRNEVRHYYGLGEKVLGGGEEERSLPFPETLRLVIIPAMALPQGYVSAFQTCCYGVGTRHVGYPRTAVILRIAPPAAMRTLATLFVLLCLSVACCILGTLDKLFQRSAHHHDAHVIVAILLGQVLAQTFSGFLVYLLDRLPGESLFGKFGIHIEIDDIACIVYLHLLNVLLYIISMTWRCATPCHEQEQVCYC